MSLWRIFRKPKKEIVRIPCEICGYLTFVKGEEGRFFICPVCFWEDDETHNNPDEPCYGPNNGLSVNQARRNYKKYGAVEERLISEVRPPKPEELPN